LEKEFNLFWKTGYMWACRCTVP